VPHHAALARSSGVVAVVVSVVALAGCAQPGSSVPEGQAAKLAVGTNEISTACGYAWELTAFGGGQGKKLAPIEAMAQTGAAKLASVYAHDQTDLYEGDSIGGVLGDSISLLRECGLTRPAKTLQQALRGPP
jgi:hypothetical protein